MSKTDQGSDWKVVSTQMHEWVAQIHRDHLLSEGIEAVILNKRDSSYTLNLGKGGYVFVLVHQDHELRAKEILEEAKISLDDESVSIMDGNVDEDLDDDASLGQELDSQLDVDSPADKSRPEDPIGLA